MQHKTSFGLDVSVEIVRDSETDTANVKVFAPIYVQKVWTMPHSYRSSQFTDHEILKDTDFVSVMTKHYSN
jgi:hypothetical protein